MIRVLRGLCLLCTMLLLFAVLYGCIPSGSNTSMNMNEEADSHDDSSTTLMDSQSAPTATSSAASSQVCGVEPPINIEMSVEDTLIADLDGDSTDEIVSIGYLEADFWYDKIILTVIDDQTLRQVQVDFGYIKSIFLAQTVSGRNVLFISYDAGSADYVTSLYTFIGADPILQDTVPGYVTTIDNQNVVINDLISVFGVWDTYRTYTLLDDVSVKPTSDSTIILSDYSKPLVAAVDLPAQLLINGKYTGKTLSIGTKMWPKATDSQTYMTFSLDDGTEGILYFSSDADSAISINGIPENKCFEFQ